VAYRRKRHHIDIAAERIVAVVLSAIFLIVLVVVTARRIAHGVIDPSFARKLILLTPLEVFCIFWAYQAWKKSRQ